jgi:hypothetical protein
MYGTAVGEASDEGTAIYDNIRVDKSLRVAAVRRRGCRAMPVGKEDVWESKKGPRRICRSYQSYREYHICPSQVRPGLGDQERGRTSI